MKCIYFFACIVFCMQAAAQKKIETYYDYNWKACDPLVARFYSTLQKTDSGWLRNDYFVSTSKLQMKALYEDSACKIYNGQSVFFYANGRMESINQKIHNKNEGVCLSFHSNGMMSDSVHHVNDSMDIEVSWFDNGVPSAAGFVLNDEMHGKWQFFHRSGKLSAVEVYDYGKLLSKVFFNEDGSPQPDTAKAESAASFKGGNNGWQNYLNKNLYWPPNYTFSKGDRAVVVVEITINEDGKPEAVEVVTPFHPAFDKIALDVVRRSPAWQPRISHNRRVKTSFRQPVAFKEEEE